MTATIIIYEEISPSLTLDLADAIESTINLGAVGDSAAATEAARLVAEAGYRVIDGGVEVFRDSNTITVLVSPIE